MSNMFTRGCGQVVALTCALTFLVSASLSKGKLLWSPIAPIVYLLIYRLTFQGRLPPYPPTTKAPFLHRFTSPFPPLSFFVTSFPHPSHFYSLSRVPLCLPLVLLSPRHSIPSWGEAAPCNQLASERSSKPGLGRGSSRKRLLDVLYEILCNFTHGRGPKFLTQFSKFGSPSNSEHDVKNWWRSTERSRRL